MRPSIQCVSPLHSQDSMSIIDHTHRICLLLLGVGSLTQWHGTMWRSPLVSTTGSPCSDASVLLSSAYILQLGRILEPDFDQKRERVRDGDHFPRDGSRAQPVCNFLPTASDLSPATFGNRFWRGKRRHDPATFLERLCQVWSKAVKDDQKVDMVLEGQLNCIELIKPLKDPLRSPPAGTSIPTILAAPYWSSQAFALFSFWKVCTGILFISVVCLSGAPSYYLLTDLVVTVDPVSSRAAISRDRNSLDSLALRLVRNTLKFWYILRLFYTLIIYYIIKISFFLLIKALIYFIIIILTI